MPLYKVLKMSRQSLLEVLYCIKNGQFLSANEHFRRLDFL
jgi:hypothetical protein